MISSLIKKSSKYLLLKIRDSIVFITITLSILGGGSYLYAAWTSISASQTQNGAGITQTLMDAIRTNLDDLNARVTTITQNNTADAGISVMPNNMSYVAGSSVLGSSVTLTQGVYFFQMYLCTGQFDTLGANAGIGFISGSGYSPVTWINNMTLSGTCGIFYSSVLKVSSTTATVAMKLSSYVNNPMSDLNPGANAFSTQFIRIQ